MSACSRYFIFYFYFFITYDTLQPIFLWVFNRHNFATRETLKSPMKCNDFAWGSNRLSMIIFYVVSSPRPYFYLHDNNTWYEQVGMEKWKRRFDSRYYRQLVCLDYFNFFKLTVSRMIQLWEAAPSATLIFTFDCSRKSWKINVSSHDNYIVLFSETILIPVCVKILLAHRSIRNIFD